MKIQPIAIGYLRTDISGPQQQWDETRMRHLAARLGYTLLKTVAFSARTDHPVDRLANVVANLKVDAVIVPGPQHFETRQIPAQIVQIADVITVEPQSTYARRATGELPELNGANK
ncbi:hypothetical protein [Nocardia sp. NBC_01388]|uniref:hypothetical protein n=1 Tax=Nocardia sp. NBC_01388 TaxID=2903596 RepID=UPI0038668D11